MTRMLAPALALTSTPALAHSGAHLHPHGAGNWLTVVLGLAVVALATALMVRRK